MVTNFMMFPQKQDRKLYGLTETSCVEGIGQEIGHCNTGNAKSPGINRT